MDGLPEPGSCFLILLAIWLRSNHKCLTSLLLCIPVTKVNSAICRIKITGASAGTPTTVWVAAACPAVDATALTTYQAAASQQFAKKY